MTRVYLFCAALVLLTSCVTVEQFPQGWATLDDKNLIGECPNISGAYSNFGDHPDGCRGRSECYYLNQAFFSDANFQQFYEGSNHPRPRLSEVRIRLSENEGRTLQVSTLNWDGTVIQQDTLSMDNGDYSCDGGNLIVKLSTAMSVAVTTIFFTQNRNFRRGADGSLIMKSWSKGLGYVAVIMPFVYSKTYWVRWMPFEQ